MSKTDLEICDAATPITSEDEWSRLLDLGALSESDWDFILHFNPAKVSDMLYTIDALGVEIERMKTDRNQMVDESWQQAEENERLRKERDDARRRACTQTLIAKQFAGNTDDTVESIAKDCGWDCFDDDGAVKDKEQLDE